MLDQFLHDNINQRTDQYGGSVENRSRFVLEVVDSVSQIFGYQRIGVRLSPFSRCLYFFPIELVLINPTNYPKVFMRQMEANH